MIHLTDTDKIQVVLGAAITTNQLQCIATWADITDTPTYSPGRSVALTNSTTAVDLVAAPASGVVRRVQLISVVNTDTVSATVTIVMDVSGTDKAIWSGVLVAGEAIRIGSQIQFIGSDGKPVGAGFSL